MIVKINDQPIPNITGMPDIDQYSAQWKDNVENFFNFMFGIPKSAWEDNGGTLTDKVADKITAQIVEVFNHIGIKLLHMSPSLLLVVCMGSILGMMIGSERCKHYASVSALGALVLQVVTQFV